ncbi:hypothetical protein Nepgr_000536 [Nepenthes gracilis]|uniref:RNase III domain-containing protein n=1 Tax=Nepenthes gracilis TaxID=150966 RepID=A0AAD3RVI3_NEPGR|nr:hypothetical protein Nepgr_000536 [Nepenthes gracilis]
MVMEVEEKPPLMVTEVSPSQGEEATEPPPSQGEEEATESFPSLDGVEEILGYRFSDKSLLEEALTHTSYPSKDFSHERLAYVGDSVLNLLITKEQYFWYPDLSPGSLTLLRAANVDTEKLARVAVKHGLHKYLRHNKPLLDKLIEEFTKEILKYPLHSNGLVDAPKVLADTVEAIIGAVFIDAKSSLDIAWSVFKGLLEPIISPQTLGVHPVKQLFELCQKKGWSIEFVDLWKESTSYNVPRRGQLIGHAAYARKKDIAFNRAAKDALDHVDQIFGPERDSSIADDQI